MNKILKILMEKSGSQIQELKDNVLEEERGKFVNNSFESFESYKERKGLSLQDAINHYQGRVQKGYEIIINQLKKKLGE